MYVKVKVKWSRYRPGVAQRVGRGIAILFHDRGTRRWWVVSSTPRPHFTPGKDPVTILHEDGWAPGSVWTGGKSRPHRDSIPDRPALSQSLYRLSYPPHPLYVCMYVCVYVCMYVWVYVCMCVCVCMYVCVCMSVCVLDKPRHVYCTGLSVAVTEYRITWGLVSTVCLIV